MDESIELQGRYEPDKKSAVRAWKHSVTWNQIFAFIAPYLLEYPGDDSVKRILQNSVLEHAGISYSEGWLNHQIYQTIKIQLLAYGLVSIGNTARGLVW
jgi:hypothetical protein